MPICYHQFNTITPAGDAHLLKKKGPAIGSDKTLSPVGHRDGIWTKLVCRRLDYFKYVWMAFQSQTLCTLKTELKYHFNRKTTANSVWSVVYQSAPLSSRKCQLIIIPGRFDKISMKPVTYEFAVNVYKRKRFTWVENVTANVNIQHASCVIYMMPKVNIYTCIMAAKY